MGALFPPFFRYSAPPLIVLARLCFTCFSSRCPYCVAIVYVVSRARDPFWSVVIVTAVLPIFLTVCYFFFVSQVAIKIIDKTQLNQGSLQKVSFLPFPFFPQYFVRDFEIRESTFSQFLYNATFPLYFLYISLLFY